MPDAKIEKISIIIPVFNVERWLDKCLSSVTGQTYKNLEIILVNDGSTDSSRELCKKWASRDNRIILIAQENKGLSAARNAGIIRVTGEYCIFVDSDDYIEPRMVELLHHAIASHGVKMAACGYYKESKKGTTSHHLSQDAVLTARQMMEDLLNDDDSCGVVVWNKIYSSALFEKARFIEGRNYEDRAIMPHLVGQCERIAVIKECLYHQRVRQGSITATETVKNLSDKWKSCSEFATFAEERFPALRLQCELFRLKTDIMIWSSMSLASGDSEVKAEYMASMRRRIEASRKLTSQLSPRHKIAAYAIIHCPTLWRILYRLYFSHYRRRRLS